MRPTKLLVVALAWSASACVVEPVLVPDPAAGARGVGTALQTEVAGVQVTIDGAAWHGVPSDLELRVTPVRVHLTNHSGHPLRVAYADFALVGATGFRYPAMAPLPGRVASAEVAPDAAAPVVELASFHPAVPVRPPPPFRHPPTRFFIAPHYHYWFPGPWVWVRPFPYDARYYERWAWPEPLPTDDMLAEALPEGVVQHDGQVQGFLYFQGVARRESKVSFELKLVDAEAQTALGTVWLPLTFRR